MTEVDSLHLVLLEFGDTEAYLRAEDNLGRKLTLHEVISLEFATVKAPLAEVAAWVVENVRVRPGFHELVERYDPVIVSSGLPQLILPVLGREGVELDVRSNFADPSPDGWRLRFRHQGPCPVCGDRCKRRSLPDERPLVFVGDGYSDRCASLACERVFARDGLARYLDGEGVPFEPFDTLHDVAAQIVSDTEGV